MRRFMAVFGLAVLAFVSVASAGEDAPAERVFRAGVYAVEVMPEKYPVIVNGMFNARTANSAHDMLYSRALVLDDGTMRLAIVVVDSLMLPRDLLDAAKEQAAKLTGIPTERMLISATHTHSAPAAMACLGTDPDPAYPPVVTKQIVRSIQLANERLVPAEIGWAVTQDWERTHCRRWIRRPDKVGNDPFGQPTVRANMHPGYQNPDVIGPAGPKDPDLSLLSIRTPGGEPIAVLANYAMHYFDSPLISSDVCGLFGFKLAARIGAGKGDHPFVGMLSQGTSGDIMWMNYGRPKQNPGLDAYADGLAEKAAEAYAKIEHRPWVSLAMAEAKLTLKRRVPDEKRLAWATPIVEKLAGKLPQSMQEIYAREAIFLHENPTAELRLQAIRIGEVGITAIPDEVYAITGLKLKKQSPLVPTFNIELANGAEGYIPPPEQHELGGYTTWPARTAGLEVQAEPQIVETLLKLLEEVAGKPRRKLEQPLSAYAEAVLESKPVAYWRLDEIEGRVARDHLGKHDGKYEGGVALYLPGPSTTDEEPAEGIPNRAPHFAGGRMTVTVPEIRGDYTVEFWFWNGLPADAREERTPLLTWLGTAIDQISIAGKERRDAQGGLEMQRTKVDSAPGEVVLRSCIDVERVKTMTWNHVALVDTGTELKLYLNAKPRCEIDLKGLPAVNGRKLIFAGGIDGDLSLEGKLDEAAVFDRALSAEEIAEHFKAAFPPE